eukprot:111506-Amphidinium_carterae.1
MVLICAKSVQTPASTGELETNLSSTNTPGGIFEIAVACHWHVVLRPLIGCHATSAASVDHCVRMCTTWISTLCHSK